MQIVFDHVKDEANDIATFYFKPLLPFHYTVGQFVQLTLPHNNPDDRGLKRWFTLSSSPTQDFVSITTKFASTISSTYKKTLRKLELGTEVSISEPMGDFVLPKLIQTPLIFVAGGIGITPFHSMLQWLNDTVETRPIKLIQAVNTESEIIFQETFDAVKQHVTIVVNNPSASWGGERGQLTAEMILGLEKPTDDTLVYVSGPEGMVEQLGKDLQAAGVNKQQIVSDYFPGYRQI